jgi:integrase/recombinase XerC
MRLDEAVGQFLESLKSEGRSPMTVDAYARDLALLRAPLGDAADVGAFRPADLLRWALAEGTRLKANGAPRDPSSMNRARSAVRGLFAFLVRAWIIERDPAQVLRVKSTSPPPPEVLAPSAEGRLLDAMGEADSWEAHRDALLVRTLIATGLRVSSLVALDAEDVNVEGGRLLLTAKGGHRQAVRIDPELATELVDLAAGGPVCATRAGRRMSVRQVQSRLAEWSDRAGLAERLHPHQLRHTFGTRRYAETRDLRAVQIALGHRSVVTTQRYVSV